MRLPSENIVGDGFMHPAPAANTGWRPNATGWPVAVLGLMMFLVPAIGVTNELMLQDTLKSALVAFGVLAAALLFFWQQRQRSAPLLWHGLVLLPLVLMLYALGSMAWSHTYLAAVEAIRWFVLSLLLWLGLNTLNRREQVATLAWGIHAGAVVASIWTALQFWLDFGLFPQGPPPASTFINRNFFAEYVVCTLPFSVFLLANIRESRWLPLLAGSLALNVVALMMTGTRSALIALGVLMPVLVMVLVRYRQQFAFMGWSKSARALVGLVLVIGVCVLGAIPSANPQVIAENTGATAFQRALLRTISIAKPAEYTEGSFSIRAAVWKATARMVMANPWTGVGAGAWEVQIPLYQPVDVGFETEYYAHNEFLQLLGEYGVPVGGLFIAVLFAYLLLAAGKTWRLHGADRQEAPLRAITLASLLALVIVSNAGFPWRLASTGALLALGLAILAASDARLGIQEAFFATGLRWRPDFSRAMLALLMCGTVLAAYITQQASEAEHKIIRAIQLGNAIVKANRSGENQPAQRKAELLQSVREGIAINPHYRKLTPVVAGQLASSGDWTNAVWIYESMTTSRPHVANLWARIAAAYTQLGQRSRALEALKQLQRLQPDTPRVRALEVLAFSRTGGEAQAADMLNDYYNQGRNEYDLVQIGYSLGLRMHNWPLAIRALELRNQTWPEEAADAYLRLGNIYANPEVHDDAKALAAFRAGLQAVPPEQQDNFRRQIPESYRTKL